MFFFISILLFSCDPRANSQVTKERSSTDMYDVLKTIDMLDKFYYPVNSKEEFNKEEAFSTMIKSILGSLNDPYSQYLSSEDLALFSSEFNTGKMSNRSLGILMMKAYKDSGSVIVADVFKDSPAYKAGVKRGDKIVKVNKSLVSDITLEDIQGIVRSSSKVSLVIHRVDDKLEKEVIKFDVCPKCFDIVKVSYEMKKNGIGYIKLSAFTANSDERIKEALTKLKEEGAKKIILDLRDNPGGELQQALSIANIFLKGPMITVEQKDSKNVMKIDNEPFDGEIPLVLLTNKGSASASELLAAALKYNNRALLVGERTYGKGSMQIILPLEASDTNRGAIKFTTSEFKGPNGEEINITGVAPHIPVGVDSSGAGLFEENKMMSEAYSGIPAPLLEDRLVSRLKNVEIEQSNQLEAAIKIFSLTDDINELINK